MNKIILVGNFVKDPELRHTENGEKYIQDSPLQYKEILDYQMELGKLISYQLKYGGKRLRLYVSIWKKEVV